MPSPESASSTVPAPGPERAVQAATLAVLLILAVLAGALCTRVGEATVYGPRAAALAAMWWPHSPRLSPFTLTAQDGSELTQDSLRGAWTVLFFGYTHCPDICPGTLALLKRARTALAAAPELPASFQVLFVSVDAQRDTPAVLERYVRYFDDSFLGASAPMETLHLLTRQFAADFAKIGGQVADEYWYDHSASLFLIAPDLRIVGEFSPPLEAKGLASQIRNIVRFIGVHG